MLDLDIEKFWHDEALSWEGNCFAKSCPQVALGIRMSDECVFAELGEQGDPWGYTPPERRYELNCRYNEKAIKIVGRPLLAENKPCPEKQVPTVPAYRQIGEVFGGKYVNDGNTTWLRGTLSDADALKKKLDEVDKLISDPEAFRAFILPPDWDEKCHAAYEATGSRPSRFSGIRGPVTLATSVFGTEDLIYLYYDDEGLFRRFSESIKNVVHAYITLTDRESGNEGKPSRYFVFFDDDCNLMTPEMYKAFGYPVLKSVFERCCPDPYDFRYQHSDSAMGHLLPLLADMDLRACNFGPTVSVREIRKYMPNTKIEGQMAPFTFMRNDEAAIIAETKRDCEQAKENDLRGLAFTTAGSINNGSLLTSMRTVMAAIQNYGQYN